MTLQKPKPRLSINCFYEWSGGGVTKHGGRAQYEATLLELKWVSVSSVPGRGGVAGNFRQVKFIPVKKKMWNTKPNSLIHVLLTN